MYKRQPLASPESSSAARVQAVLQEVGDRFRATWPQRFATLAKTEQAIQSGDFSLTQLQAILSQIHKLAGSLGTFGYDQAAEIAASLEQSVLEQINQQTQWAQQFSTSLASLQQELLTLAPPKNHCTAATKPDQNTE
uniref:Hpt domain-containing protein n=1 Tax=Lyngbya confervoides BDU141951 TaxID=1574623 RepID=A0A8T6QTF8_9CYAN